MEYKARSASNRTDNWPLWFVSNETGLNVTGKLFEALTGESLHGAALISRKGAETLAETANRNLVRGKAP